MQFDPGTNNDRPLGWIDHPVKLHNSTLHYMVLTSCTPQQFFGPYFFVLQSGGDGEGDVVQLPEQTRTVWRTMFTTLDCTRVHCTTSPYMRAGPQHLVCQSFGYNSGGEGDAAQCRGEQGQSEGW